MDKRNACNFGWTGGVPIGTIISFYGKIAPEGYLVCDGSVYLRADYPELALHLVSQFDDLIVEDVTKFRVPDLQGEFLRGSGTNSHYNSILTQNEGSGAEVGVHQASTAHLKTTWYSKRPYCGSPSNGMCDQGFPDVISTGNVGFSEVKSAYGNYNGSSPDYSSHYSARPTNTSVLFCIKAN